MKLYSRSPKKDLSSQIERCKLASEDIIYFAEQFLNLTLRDEQKAVLEAFQFYSASATKAPRQSGKSLLVHVACAWALIFGNNQVTLLSCINRANADQARDNILKLIEKAGFKTEISKIDRHCLRSKSFNTLMISSDKTLDGITRGLTLDYWFIDECAFHGECDSEQIMSEMFVQTRCGRGVHVISTPSTKKNTLFQRFYELLERDYGTALSMTHCPCTSVGIFMTPDQQITEIKGEFL